MVGFTSDQMVILALVFILGLLVGAFMTAGGRRKWKMRYREESARREALERELRDDRARWETREKEWREQDSLRGPATSRDIDGDGVRDEADRRPTDDRRA
jgi:hypothetical protein